ncbi:MAG: hypothetical protein Q8910_01625 [Bacteroidota bacterium]|nr:hypothetical protein [Bacteroidota bacterium]
MMSGDKPGEKRAGQRQFYSDKAFQEAQLDQLSNLSDRINALENTLTIGFNNLVKFLYNNTSKVEVKNHLKEIATPDVLQVVKIIEKLDKDLLDKNVELKPIIQVLTLIQQELTKIPKDPVKFEQKDAFKVTNLSEIKFDTKSLEKTIKDELAKLNIKPDAPIINVEKADNTGLEKLLKDILKGITANKPEKLPESFKVANLDEIKPTDTSKIEEKLDESNKQLQLLVKKPAGGGGGGSTIPFTDDQGKPKFVVLTSDGKLPVDVDMATEGIATETTLAAMKAGLSGGTKVGITLTLANTCYLCPASTPTADYTIQLYNGSGVDMYISPDNTASNGVLFKAGGTFVYDLKANEPLYLYCGSAGQSVSAIKWARV